MRKILIAIINHPLLTTIALVLCYTAICVMINPPFTVIGDYDRTIADTPLIDLFTGTSIVAPLVVVGFLSLHKRIVIKDGKLPSRILTSTIDTCWVLFMAGIIVLTIILAVKAIITYDTSAWRYWAGQAIGMTGFILYVILRVLWKMNSLIPGKINN